MATEKGMHQTQIDQLKEQQFSSFSREDEEKLVFFNAMQNPIPLKDHNGTINVEHVYCKPALYDEMDEKGKVKINPETGEPFKKAGIWLILMERDENDEWRGYKTSSIGVLNAVQNLIDASKRPLPWTPPIKVKSERVPGKNGKELRTLKLA